MKFHFRTFGCKVNWLDTARISAALQLAGHEPVVDERAADVVFINSCTVTAEADRKAHQAASSAVRARRAVGVLGCSPRVDPSAWHGSEQRVYQDEYALLADYGVETDTLPFPLNNRTRLPIAIQMGCDDQCTFCITRIARGTHHNESAETILTHLLKAREQGVQEVILTGINLAAWGSRQTTKPEQARLGQLLQHLLHHSDIPRIRLSSLGPQYLHNDFFDALSDKRICAHLHLSVQSGSPAVLQAMNRGHGVEEVYRVAERARHIRDEIALAADLIAGFPGEGEREFAESVTLVNDLRFAKLHVFPYSPRSGTPAALCDDSVSLEEKRERARELRRLGTLYRQAFIKAQIDSEFDVLVEKGGKGLTGNYIRVHALGGKVGEIISLRLSRALIAEPGW